MTTYDLGQISHLLYVEEQLRAHPFMRPVHEEVLAELRAHAAGERAPNVQQDVKPVEEPAHEPDHEPEPDQLIAKEEEEHAA